MTPKFLLPSWLLYHSSRQPVFAAAVEDTELAIGLDAALTHASFLSTAVRTAPCDALLWPLA